MSLRIAFMGTPDFAVASLKQLHESDHEVVGVVTVADKPAGRGRKVLSSAVKKYAEANELPILQPVKLRDPDFLTELKSWNADLFVVVAFRMLPEVVWKMPSKGTINLHGSLLPDYRGAAPIHWAVINGEKTTGCTTFFIDEKIDTGAILLQRSLAIGEDETTGDVHDHMMIVGAELLEETIGRIESGDIEPVKQDKADQEKHAPKIHKSDCQIDWNQSVETVHDFIRGMSPFPCAWSQLNEEAFKIFKGRKTDVKHNAVPGTIKQTKKELFVACEDGWYQVLELQPQGKRRMDVVSFVLGNDLNGAQL